jgi:type II secretory pathway pseudopilin PulG
MTSAPRKKNRTAIIVAVIALASCLPCTGILAAIAIPSFISYVRRSKTVEARSNLRQIASGIAALAESGGGLPPRLPPTPPLPAAATRRPWPADADPGWSDIGFAPPEPLYYSYEYVPDADGRGFVVRAYGDLDGDGMASTFELRGHVDASGAIIVDSAPTVRDELE